MDYFECIQKHFKIKAELYQESVEMLGVGQRQFILSRWKYVDWMLMWDWNDNVLSRMTTRLSTCGKEGTDEFSTMGENVSAINRIDLANRKKFNFINV